MAHSTRRPSTFVPAKVTLTIARTPVKPIPMMPRLGRYHPAGECTWADPTTAKNQASSTAATTTTPASRTKVSHCMRDCRVTGSRMNAHSAQVTAAR